MNVALIMNIADIDTRKAVVHAVNKGPIVDSELGGIEEPASQLFSENAPYCDIDRTPKFNYDLEKATFFSDCATGSKKSSDDILFIVLLIVICAIAVVLGVALCFLMKREKDGMPVFSPLVNEGDVPKVQEVQLGANGGSTITKAQAVEAEA